MNCLLAFLSWGCPLLLSLHPAQLSRAAPTYSKEQKSTEVVAFLKVYERSMCQVRETLVDVLQEYPEEVEYIFKPSCVPLMRCAGCCTDEALECVPTEVYNVTMQIMRSKPFFSQLYVDKSFQQHSQCECRPKKEIKGKQEKKRGKGPKRKRKKIRYKSRRFHCEPCTDTERRRHLFVQDPHTCKCSCKNTDSRCKSRQLELNERTCRRGKMPRALQTYGAPLPADYAH